MDVILNNVKCKICHQEFNNLMGLVIHITRIHKISHKDYAIKYQNISENSGFCLCCGKKTTFLAFYGYRQYCSRKCKLIHFDRMKNVPKTEKEFFEKLEYKHITSLKFK
jgi:endogenous inhibitor of DNA gyrase (YacG/DUF329 family)